MHSSKRHYTGAVAALAAVALSGALPVVHAGDANPPPPPAGMARHQHGPQRQPGGPERSFIEILHKLDLSADQQEKIRSVLGNAHAQWRSESGRDLADLPALGNPGDPQHAAAVAAAKARAAERIALWSDAEQQVYTLLTPAQQARLPQLLTELQKEIAARHRDDPPGGPPPP